MQVTHLQSLLGWTPHGFTLPLTLSKLLYIVLMNKFSNETLKRDTRHEKIDLLGIRKTIRVKQTDSSECCFQVFKHQDALVASGPCSLLLVEPFSQLGIYTA